MKQHIKNYTNNLEIVLKKIDLEKVNLLSNKIFNIWKKKKSLYLCGNGGSAANANHIANDFLYGVGRGETKGINVESLAANSAVITCLANDIGYENIFSEQLYVKGEKGDLLICLSGSGNSKNIINVLKKAREIGVETFLIVSYSGGKCKNLADNFIHVKINDMQIAEDMQLIILHMCMQWISKSI
jgi:D-sedoheptulose 7-phosphate isomerase